MLSKTVLLVEDNEDNRVVYSTILQYFGYTVVEAADGEEGIRLAQEHHPDVILMDISIPVVDGWQATRLLKGDVATSSIPVIALTAHALPEDRLKSRAVGFDGYLAKPCEPRRVVEEVQRFIGISNAAKSA
jgi:two-component system, cell cycle response regulator DivK